VASQLCRSHVKQTEYTAADTSAATINQLISIYTVAQVEKTNAWSTGEVS